MVPSLTGCGGSSEGPLDDAADRGGQIESAVTAGILVFKADVLGTIPHSADARTEGLKVYEGKIYESTSTPGRSEVRELDATTGRMIRSAPLPDDLEGAGITVIGSLIWQVTRSGGTALQWNRKTLVAGGRVPWSGSGGGLCRRDSDLIASDGSSKLRVVDRNGMGALREIDVRLLGKPLSGLGDLECAQQRIYANVLGTHWLAVIDADTGEVKAVADISDVVPPNDSDTGKQEPNGIAQIPGSDQFLLTGQYWPTIFRVRFKFAFAPSGGPQSSGLN